MAASSTVNPPSVRRHPSACGHTANVAINDAIKRASEVEAVLRAPNCIAFFNEMYGNDPIVWSDDLTGMTRLRVERVWMGGWRECAGRVAKGWYVKFLARIGAGGRGVARWWGGVGEGLQAFAPAET